MINKEYIQKMYYKIKSFYIKDENINNNFLNEYELEAELKQHMLRVGEYAELLADLMCLDKEKIKQIKKGAMLHDVGKKMIDKKILNKSSNLNLDEFKLIKDHSKLGLKILNKKYANEIIENTILFHHEKWNGNGYPFGLSKTKIPIEARIVSIVDCYDALTSDRAYKKKLSHDKALEILRDESGSSFDPDIVSIFEIFETKFKRILDKSN